MTRPAFADRLRAARRALGLTPAQAAAAARINLSVYYKLEQGERCSPTHATVLRLIRGGLGLEHFFDADAVEAAAARLRATADDPVPIDNP